MTRFLIAGAGIGGLTAALTLARAGVDVTLVERADALKEAGAGVQLSPNATRILRRLGLLDRLADVALEPVGIRVCNGRSGRLLSFMPLEDARQRWGAPYLVAHRADLQTILADAVAAEPAICLELDTTLAGFGTTETSVHATMKQGRITRTLDADALIGADGIRSNIRTRLVEGDDAPQETGRTAWRALIPSDAVDPHFRVPETNLWLGHDAHLVQYPLDGGRQINVVAITRDLSRPTADLWSAKGDQEVIRRRFAAWHATARELIIAAPSWTTWPLFDRKPLGAWSVGRVALLGDAAHPIFPFLAQGSAQAIEDAEALAGAVASISGVPQALCAYSHARMDRAARVQQASRQLGRLYHLSGAEAAVRDLGMRMLGGRRLLTRYDWLYSA